MSKFPYHSLSSVHGSFVVEGQAEVSAIRFSLTSLPDSGKFPGRVMYYEKSKKGLTRFIDSAMVCIKFFKVAAVRREKGFVLSVD